MTGFLKFDKIIYYKNIQLRVKKNAQNVKGKHRGHSIKSLVSQLGSPQTNNNTVQYFYCTIRLKGALNPNEQLYCTIIRTAQCFHVQSENSIDPVCTVRSNMFEQNLAAAVVLLLVAKRKRKGTRRWSKDWYKNRQKYTHENLLKDLILTEEADSNNFNFNFVYKQQCFVCNVFFITVMIFFAVDIPQRLHNWIHSLINSLSLTF